MEFSFPGLDIWHMMVFCTLVERFSLDMHHEDGACIIPLFFEEMILIIGRILKIYLILHYAYPRKVLW